MDTADRVLSVLRSVTDKTIPSGEEESLFDSGVLDSFALPDLVSGLEKEFGVTIPDGDLNPRKFESVARISAYVESKL